MDERTHFFLYLLLAGGSFALLGALYGAATGYATCRDGRAAGTAIGHAVAWAFARLSDDSQSPTTRSVLVCSVDGAVFGLLLGLVIGIATGWQDGGNWLGLGRLILASGGLVSLALLLGNLAGVLRAGGQRSVLGLFLGGMLGAGIGLWLGRIDGLFFGTLFGAAAGAIAARLAG